MDLAAIVITASAIIIILQVLSIILIVTSRKTVVKPEVSGPVPVTNENRDFRKRRDDNRFNKKPMIDQRQKPVINPQPQAVDYVEKSLRDINLRLKNAERDQENARKKIRDVIQSPQGPQNPQRKFDHNDNRPNRGRDDDFRRRNRDSHNRPPNNQFRERDQNRSPQIDRTPVEQPGPSVSLPVNAPVSPAPEAAQSPRNPIASQPVQPVIEKEPLAIVPENTEILHGRKVLVRRRILTAEEQAQAANAAPPAVGLTTESVVPEQQAGKEAVQPVQEPAAQSEKPADVPAQENSAGAESEFKSINFGR